MNIEAITHAMTALDPQATRAERRLQLDLRAAIQAYLDRGYQITTRSPLHLERGRLHVHQLPCGALSTYMEQTQ